MSPRISFSHDLSQTDIVPIEQYIRSGSSASIDFDFCVFRESFDQESSSADELFFDGKILPIEIKKRLAPPRTADGPPPNQPAPAFPPPQPSPPSHRITKNTISTHVARQYPNPESEEKKSSFWSFKRSTSLNCGSGYARTLCPLPLLSRSNSTGSTASSKRASLSNNQKQNFLKNSTTSPLKQSQLPSASASNTHQRPPLKRTNHSYNNGIKINRVLNVPHGNLFGLGSIFSGGKDKIKKKY
ncbi:hypothetical protein F511_13326 [Dorcoceras hygrometricum]|uniref:Uncharacterized protein n=1 Tax=Dorcoceras hygrometricum TaxID=472368 RepID=A0A2Z7C689_9LAMI|nr:hypothetical protein F511_13326 [Dorcoceras hygrometricum]